MNSAVAHYLSDALSHLGDVVDCVNGAAMADDACTITAEDVRDLAITIQNLITQLQAEVCPIPK